MNVLGKITLACLTLSFAACTMVAQQPTDFTKAAESTINGVVSIKCYATPRSYGYGGGGYDPFSDPFFEYFFGQRRQQRPHPKQQEQQQT